MDMINIVKCLDQFFSTLNIPFQTKAFNYKKLFEDGLLTIPLLVDINKNTYAVFIIYNIEEAAQYRDANKLLSKSCFEKTLYISTIDIDTVKHKISCLDLLRCSDLGYHNQWISEGMYGMWWKTKKEPLFTNSKTKQYLDIIHRATREYPSYFFGYILSELEVEGFEKTKRKPLPEKPLEITVKGPEQKDIIISISREKGIRFHFPVNSTNRKYRAFFLDQISANFKAYHLMLNLRELPRDNNSIPNQQSWYTFMCEVMEEKENKGEWTDVVGGVQIE